MGERELINFFNDKITKLEDSVAELKTSINNLEIKSDKGLTLARAMAKKVLD